MGADRCSGTAGAVAGNFGSPCPKESKASSRIAMTHTSHRPCRTRQVRTEPGSSADTLRLDTIGGTGFWGVGFMFIVYGGWLRRQRGHPALCLRGGLRFRIQSN